MDHFAGLDVSVKETSVCIVDDVGKIVREVKVASEPEVLLAVLKKPAYRFKADVPLFVEHCEAVAAEIDVKLRWLGEQARRGLSVWSDALPVRHVMLEVAYEPSVVGSL